LGEPDALCYTKPMSQSTSPGNTSLLGSSVGRLRIVGIVEGTSFLLLLFIAMPMKYAMDEPAGVYWLGRAHGGLWMLYLLALADAWIDRSWGLGKVFLLFLASCLPFGPFVADRKLKQEG
jgi:integral membrane protein